MKTLHEKAIRLIEGGFVEAEGLFVRAVIFNGSDHPCFECEMDSLCHAFNDIWKLCLECDSISDKKYCLTLNKKQRS